MVGVLLALLTTTPATADDAAPAADGLVDHSLDLWMAREPLPSLDGPAPPEHVTATAVPDGIRLEWTSSPDSVDHYAVRRNGEPVAVTAELNVTDTAGTPYDVYTVSARQSGSEGKPSQPAAAQSGDCINVYVGAIPPVYLVPSTCIAQALAFYQWLRDSIRISLPDEAQAILDEIEADQPVGSPPNVLPIVPPAAPTQAQGGG